MLRAVSHVKMGAFVRPAHSFFFATNKEKCATETLESPAKLHLQPEAIIRCLGDKGNAHSPLRLCRPAAVRDYLRLFKHKLSFSVAATAATGFLTAPEALHSTQWLVRLLAVTLGTTLCAFSAASFNQCLEAPYDAQMPRTRNRVLPAHRISLPFAWISGLTTCVAGVAVLLSGTNILTAALGFANVLLYAGLYTLSKRRTTFNTQIGAAVGAVPPLMGALAADSHAFYAPASYILPLCVAFWQLPHFYALSWGLRAQYARAGFRMLAVTQPQRARFWCVASSVGLWAASMLLWAADRVSVWFLCDAGCLNALYVFYSCRFYACASNEAANRLFGVSLFHLPLFIMLLWVHAK